ncbi:amidohydrolase family protein [Planotetraspora kaengkrachanensis]|uniref:TRZ/ATZ family hydrolase n=1 Tax=Planotetraspora kaengkrachanensis TaxID=575193 RepID=A0A8J3Q126_9ACTN|nr:amidohydrolase family protein [Planotetraspora kaengkrachanensis]GIG84665.1 TRZ/ATZ family hydrolase [Planotetraspora kaengkrachanensis]
MAKRLLIQGGVAVDTDPVDTDPVAAAPADVLIEDGRIAAVRPGLPEPEGAEVVDAHGMLVLPGFVDTHRHTWQAGIRAIGPDIGFPGYLELVLGRLAPAHRPEDVYAGNLAGALECLDAGITTLVDWSHIQFTPDHTAAAVEALRRSGIRAVFGYCHPQGGDPEASAARGRRVYDEHFGTAGGLVTMAIAPLGPEIVSEEEALHEWGPARDLGLPVTVHMGYDADRADRGLDFLERNGLLTPGTSYVHGNHYSDEALKRIADSGGGVSVSPVVEVELGLGYPVTGRVVAAGAPAGFGADTVVSGPGDMFSLMRAAYALERARPNPGFTTRDALLAATLDGARTAGLGDVVGSLGVGKQADLVLLRTDLLGVAPAHDAVGAVVLSADTRSVDTVIVGGRIVKRDGRLLDHVVEDVLGPLAESAARLAAV